MAAQQTLLQASIGVTSPLARALAILGGSLVIALGAQVSVPMLPVPMTLQTLAVVMVGLTAGSRLGAAGLPVFSGGAAGLAYMAGPTAGFLFGFVALAWAAGRLAETGIARSAVGTFLGVAAISALLYGPGVLWLTAVTPLDLSGALARGMVPFLLGDAVKAAIAAVVVAGGWSVLRNRR